VLGIQRSFAALRMTGHFSNTLGLRFEDEKRARLRFPPCPKERGKSGQPAGPLKKIRSQIEEVKRLGRG